MGKQKINCKIFTPQNVVISMMDMLGYKENLYGQKILENSCGDGRFLEEIVKRYIDDCRRRGYTEDEILSGLARDIWAYEIDIETFNECINNLSKLIKEYSISDVKWSVFNDDALKSKLPTDFSFVIGNPPYITYSALSKDDRSFIRKSFTVCEEGKPDYYYAFIESALKSLEANGRMVYLLPSNFFKIRYAQKVRAYLLPSLTDVYDYGEKKEFETALTASTIIVCDKARASNRIMYHDVVSKEDRSIDKDLLIERWVFTSQMSKQTAMSPIRFGDCFSASSSIATLCNEAFVLKVEDPVLRQIEPKVIKKAISPKSYLSKKEERIIFPYYFDQQGKLQRYDEDDFVFRFPAAVAHLKQYKDRLDSRDSDKTAKWFEYGRSQAIGHMNQDKLLLSTVITGKVKVTLLDKNTIPYSGIYIIANKGFSLFDAKRILESPSFFEYAKAVGVQVNGTSIRISINDINNYIFYQS